MDIGIGGYGGTYIDTDRGSIYELHMPDPFCFNACNMPRLLRPGRISCKGRHKAFQHHRCFSGPGYTGYHSQPPFRDAHIQRFDSMDRRRFHPDAAILKYTVRFLLAVRPIPACKEGTNHGYGIRFDFLNRPFSDHPAAISPGFWPHLYQPVGFLQDLGVMIHKQN